MSALLKHLRTRLSGGFVLAFHDIAPDRLTDLVESLHPARAVSLTELIDRSKGGRPTSGLFAITVDDGVGETVRNLSRVFVARNWPGTFYICTRYVDSMEAMAFQWWRKIMPLLPSKTLSLKSGPLDLSKKRAIQELSKRMERMWHSERLESYLPLIRELAQVAGHEHGLEVASIRPPDPITWSEVAQLSSNELISFESHGVSHAAVATLSEEELLFEMKHSRNVIASHSGRPCRHFAYPFGSERSIGSRAATAAQLFYDSASTMNLGGVDGANPWLLPRIPLYPKNPAWFANLKILLTCNRVSAPITRASYSPAETGTASFAGKSGA